MSFGPDYEKWHSCRDLHPVCQIESLVSYYIEDRDDVRKWQVRQDLHLHPSASKAAAPLLSYGPILLK